MKMYENHTFFGICFVNTTKSPVTDSVFRKPIFMWPIFSFIGYIHPDGVFRKPDNWRQIYNQTSSTFYTSNEVSRRKNYQYVIGRLQNSCLITFLKKYRSIDRKCRSSHRRCSVKKGVLKNFANFTEKHLRWSLQLQAFTQQVF